MIEKGCLHNILPCKDIDIKERCSIEVCSMIREFATNGWTVYVTTIMDFDFDSKVWRNVYNVSDGKTKSMSVVDINKEIGLMIIRNVGSVEGNYDVILKYLNYIVDSQYIGCVLNNPIAMIKGMKKDYLVNLDRNALQRLGMETIPTDLFPNTINLDSLRQKYNHLGMYVVKPSTGELSNSIECLSNVTEDFLRRKEKKVGGWIVQPIREEIWNGEYQMVFLGKEMLYSQIKHYHKNGVLPSQKDRSLENYSPSDFEIGIGRKVIQYFEEFYDTDINICRIDFMKKLDGTPILLEFECVNPGFFIGYHFFDGDTMKKVVEKFRLYCENLLLLN